MSIYAKLALIQKELKCNKSQYNSFGKYNYRSCEDILEAAKPLCVKHGAVLIVGDEIVMIGNRFYVKATATLVDADTGETVSNTAYAREEESKKGIDSSQLTGVCSSYSRKYCLNGLFCIDDTKDADTDEHQNERTNKEKKLPKPMEAAKEAFGGESGELPNVIVKDGVTQVLVKGTYYPLTRFTAAQLSRMVNDKAYAACHDEVRKLLEGMG